MAAKTSGKAGTAAVDESSAGMVRIYIMGKQYEVPEGLTIQKALEYAGLTLLRGCGCRGGFCGACGTVYRTAGDYKLKVALACQTVVEDGMYLTQIPFYPANKAIYDIEKLTPSLESLVQTYPEFMRCVQCNTCRKVCPQDIEVMQYMATAMRGDLAKTADLSFDCIMCGLCASRCPADTVQYYVGILARRLYGRYMMPEAKHLAERVKELDTGKFDKEIDDMIKMKQEDLKKLYNTRDIEPAEETTKTEAVSATEAGTEK
ncbi:MAG: 4Fe-4S dicluster domain-containing protein [Candidatus Eisenbacteria bacterium]